MPIDLDKFEQTTETDVMEIYERSVETPMPDDEGRGPSYTTQSNTQTAYKRGDTIIKISKVSDNGWSVWQYSEGDDGFEIDERLASGLSEQQAQRLALQQIRSI